MDAKMFLEAVIVSNISKMHFRNPQSPCFLSSLKIFEERKQLMIDYGTEVI